MAKPPRIAIIGGGPAGLTTGVLLHKHGIPFTIFELRQRPTEEEISKPSGSLDIRQDSGIAALKECGILEEYESLTGDCSEASRICDKHGNVVHADEGEESNNPEISRHALTKLLMSHIPGDQIRWSHKLLAVTKSMASEHTEITLDFGSNGKHIFDLVIGADGAWSKVRTLLTDAKPFYAGCQIITLTIRDITTKYPKLANMVGAGSFSALGDRHGVMSQRGVQDSARIYIFLHSAEENFATNAGLAGKSPIVARELLLSDKSLLASWGQSIKDLVTVACDEEMADNPNTAIDIRPMCMLPIGYHWEHQIGAAVIGDAAHLAPPAGEGVNIAMLDSLLLVKAVVKAYEVAPQDGTAFQKALEPSMKEFEDDLMARGKESAQQSLQINQMMFGEDGAQAMANFFLSFGENSEETNEHD